MMMRSRTPSCSAGGIAGSVISAVVTAGSGVGWELVTGGTTRMVGAAFPRPRRRPLALGVDGDLGDVGLETVVALHQAGHPDQHEPRLHRLVERHVGGGVELAVRGRLEPV